MQLLTHSKIFAGDATAFGDAPNTNIGVITPVIPARCLSLIAKLLSSLSAWDLPVVRDITVADL